MRALLTSLFISTIIVLSAPFFLKNNYGRTYIDLNEMESFTLPIYLSLVRKAMYDKTDVVKNLAYQQNLHLDLPQKIQSQKSQSPTDTIIRWQDANGQWHFANKKPFVTEKVARPKVMDESTPLPDPDDINSIPATKVPGKNNIEASSDSGMMKLVIPVALLIVAGFFILIMLKTLLRHFADQARIKREKDKPQPHTPKREYAEYKAISVTALNPYAVLGVTPVSSIDEIKKAYKSLIRQYHPDKVDSLGDGLKAVALEKTAEINNAYELIKEQKGF